jgi:membrane protease YdiL (CAAX protease family)
MSSDSLLTALGSVTSFVVLIVAVYIYVALIRQISARAPTSLVESPRTFGWPEAILASGLVCLLLLNVVAAFSGRSLEVNSRVLVENLLFTAAIVLLISAFLAFRGFDLNALGGFSRMSFLRTLSTGIVLLLAAYPLIVLAEAMTRGLFGVGPDKQSIVELFDASRTIGQRVMIIVFAVAVAPLAEEFLFRLFLYGVLRRYFGQAFGIIVSALLFAAVHNHLPSFAPLFVLGICFAIAYEWSGSILVSMTMHSLFNSLSLTVLAFPEIFRQ